MCVRVVLPFRVRSKAFTKYSYMKPNGKVRYVWCNYNPANVDRHKHDFMRAYVNALCFALISAFTLVAGVHNALKFAMVLLPLWILLHILLYEPRYIANAKQEES